MLDLKTWQREVAIQSYWLYENMKHLVWIVKIMKKNGTSSEETIERFATGFCLQKKKEGYIITTTLHLGGATKILVRVA